MCEGLQSALCLLGWWWGPFDRKWSDELVFDESGFSVKVVKVVFDESGFSRFLMKVVFDESGF